MARITRAEAFLVDLVPKVKRTDAIQSFKSQETIFVTLTDADGAQGRGYSYTIGDGGPSVLALLRHSLLPALMVLTFREGEVPPGHRLHATVGAIGAADALILELAPLSADAVASLAQTQAAA